MLALSEKIVVIAPDLGLRQSLTFALEVEGYRVEAFGSWNDSRASVATSLCIIIDEQVLRAHVDAQQYLFDSDRPVILLADGMSPAIGYNPGLTLAKPFDGAELMNLVKCLERTRGNPNSSGLAT